MLDTAVLLNIFPSMEKIKEAFLKMLDRIPAANPWMNDDCGLKIKGAAETVPSLERLVQPAVGLSRATS
jgi:5-methyltetrahydropteroyltriglutamate--homocysteine methyltransferase